MRLVLTGGGTGGHVYPMLAVLQALRANAKAEPSALLYIGGRDSIEQRLAAQGQIDFQPISVGGLRGLSPWTQVRNLARLGGAFARVRGLLGKFRPDVILATGGYVSASVILAGAQARVPVLVYLPDLEPGLAIKRLARWATCIAVSFPEVVRFFDPSKTVVTGYPVRQEFFGIDRAAAKTHFQLQPDQNVMTIFGGSRGARSINQAVAANLTRLVGTCQLIHVTGQQDYAAASRQRNELAQHERNRYILAPYLDQDMPLALGAADLIVARAGAATLGEFPALGAASLLVPYPYAGQHQDKNAEFLVSRGAAVQLENERLLAELGPTIERLLGNPAQLSDMRARSRSLSRPDASRNIAGLLDELARGHLRASTQRTT